MDVQQCFKDIQAILDIAIEMAKEKIGDKRFNKFMGVEFEASYLIITLGTTIRGEVVTQPIGIYMTEIEQYVEEHSGTDKVC